VDQYQFGVDHGECSGDLFSGIETTRREFTEKAFFKFLHQARYLIRGGKREVIPGQIDLPVSSRSMIDIPLSTPRKRDTPDWFENA
jgi:hypothetical protein